MTRNSAVFTVDDSVNIAGAFQQQIENQRTLLSDAAELLKEYLDDPGTQNDIDARVWLKRFEELK